MTDLSTSLQVNILTLITYDEKHSIMLRNLIDKGLFEGIFYEVASRTYKYIDKYRKPPQDHLYDLFADILEGKDTARAELFREVLDDLSENSDYVQADFVVGKVKEFIQEQELRQVIYEGADILSGGEDESEKIDKVKSLLANAIKTQVDLFDPGVVLNDYSRSLKFLEEIETEFSTGIKELDFRGITPARGELYLFLGLYNIGKTHFLVNLARRAILNGKRVCHVSLEMPEDRMCQRYFANLLGIASYKKEISLPQFEVDEAGNLSDIWFRDFEPKLSYEDANISQEIMRKTEKMERYIKNLRLKYFPTSTLSINELQAYLDMLEQTGFTTDMLILDYVDLMALPSDKDNYRVALGQLTKQVRGIAGERNLAAVTVSQVNREGSKSKHIKGHHVGEDWSKLATVDNCLVYEQTEAEKELGLARIITDKVRYGEKIAVLISQNYAMSQFVRDSHLLTNDYWTIIEDLNGEENE